eukprot:1157878-Pelagomonas_calceolata.AAC.2
MHMHRSAGGAALAEPMPIIAAAHARDPMSLSFHRQQALWSCKKARQNAPYPTLSICVTKVSMRPNSMHPILPKTVGLGI